jgi:aldose sugar dehydrogenase
MRYRVATGGVSVTVLAVWMALAPPGSAQQADIGISPAVLSQGSYTFDTAEQGKIRLVVLVRGLTRPFSVALLPGGDALVTERGARLRLAHNVTARATENGSAATLAPQPVAGLPDMPAFRGGGLHEVALHPNFADNRLVYFTYNKPGDAIDGPAQRQSALTLARGRFDGRTLTNVQELFTGEWRAGASGSRLAFGLDGMLYITTGAPFGDDAQNPGSVHGKVLRLRDDGSVPGDNPFVGRPGTRPEIFSMGHRDQLGLAIHPDTGAVVAAEHGPNGGDEVNLILPGRNYGWPRFTFGRSYEGPRLVDAPVGADIEEPLVVWLPSIAPAGLTFYSGDRFPTWRGNLFVGSARRGQIPGTGGLERVVFNDKLEELRRETLLTQLHRRIRDVRQGPDGLLYLLTDDEDGALLRIEPAG